MNSVIPLGRFDKVPLTEAWPTEDGNFTPWLAEPNAIALLGEVLGIEIEVEAVEHWVGSFRADILARATDEADHRVLIENQFGRPDHKHLGQILTYLAGIEGAKTIVWIAEAIQSDHRAAIDWLNTHTDDEFSFFAIEIELWRIDNSAPAPRFSVVASPNDWARTARSAVRQVDEAALSEGDRIRLAYWASFGQYLSSRSSNFRIKRPSKDSWFSFGIGKSGYTINPVISTEKNSMRVELYISNDMNKSAFHSLEADRTTIEDEFGFPLEWQELPGRRASRIAIYWSGCQCNR